MGFDMNYKIKVANESGNREVQDLFRELGGEWGSRVDSDHYDKEFLYLTNSIIEYDDSISEFESVDECEEITLPELRDLVVLKRNSIEDANVSEENCLYDLYLTELKELYYYHCGKKKWILSNLNGDDNYYKLLKPIEKKEMKEYLIKINGAYKLCNLLEEDVTDEYIEIPEGDTWAYKSSRGSIITMHGKVCQAFIGDLVWERESMNDNSIVKDYLEKQPDGSYVMKSGFAFKDAGWVEIPEGAVKAYLNRSGTINFVNADDDYMNGVTHGEWVNTHRGKHESSGHQLVWQRESPNDKLASAEQYRQAEVLPFIDDEPDFKKLADLLVETTKHKTTAREWDLSDYDFAESDAWIESNVEQDNVNNPSHYADSAIECIDAMQAMLTPEQFVGYLRGNIFKYQWRYEKKNGIEDLRKSQWYLDKLISVL